MFLVALTFPPQADQTEPPAERVLALTNELDPVEALAERSLADIDRIDLHFPKFTDGRAFSQAVMLRRRAGYRGAIRAHGDVLVDQLLQMQRTGFTEAVLRDDQNPAHAARLLGQFSGFYQGDALHTQPRFVKAAPPAASLAPFTTSLDTTAASLHSRASPDFEDKLAATRTLLQRVALEFAPLVQASSLGAEDVVITHLIAELTLPIGVFVLDTERLHPQTLGLLESNQRARSQRGLPPITVLRPERVAAEQFVQAQGQDAMYRSLELRKACCHIRKVEPLQRALAPYSAWITGLRREQSSARGAVPDVERGDPQAAADSVAARSKINPLAQWTWGDVWHYISTRQVPYNPLHDEFYPSIGCAPCTRSVTLGEDMRAGRWWWENEDGSSRAKECGLHVCAPFSTDANSSVAHSVHPQDQPQVCA